MPAHSETVDSDLKALREQVNATVSTFLAEQAEALLAVSADLRPLVETLEGLLQGGKRLRPTFAYWGWRAAGGAPGPAVVRAASSLEFVQACALVHDDVMDASDSRRGKPAAHRRMAAIHRDHGYVGSADDFGVGSAILLGDLCLSWGDELLVASGLPADAVARAKPLYDTMRTELMAGQYLDLLIGAKGGFDADQALLVARYKSAKYTIERPLQIGAAAAGADADFLAGLSDFGVPLGEAFQLRDDLLGVFGDPAVTGKPAGDDLREGKRTALVALAWQNADARQREVLRQHLGDPAITPATVERLRAIIVDTGAAAAVEDMIEQRALACEAALSALRLDATAEAALSRLSVMATRREA